MAVVPTMMVLYTDDAVEVRYSDGSLLQLSPCGSSMYHQDLQLDIPRHPLAGAQGVKKWTQFVTSAHKAKVLQAVDFRNRFASRPFLCPSLMAPEDIVSLYARIDQIAWGRTGEDTHIEVFEDGSRRAVSRDQYASLVLSPHGQDFTVCYLSRISADSASSTDSGSDSHPPKSLPSRDQSESVLSHSQSSHSSSKVESHHAGGVLSQSHPHYCDHSSSKPGSHHSEDKKLVHAQPLVSNSACGVDPEAVVSSSNHHGSDAALNRDCNNSTPVNASSCDHGSDAALKRDCSNCTPVNETLVSREATVDASGLILSDGTLSTPGRSIQPVDVQSSVFSVQHDISSISRVSTPDGLRGMVDCDDTLPLTEDVAVTSSPLSADAMHSSPLNPVNTVSCTGKGDSNNREAIGGSELNNALKETESEAGAQRSEAGAQRSEAGARRSEAGARRSEVGARRSEAVWSGGSRQHYSWVTQHVSCNGCPPAWRHPLRLLQHTDPASSILVSECNLTVSTNIARGLVGRSEGAGDTSRCVMSPVVSPLPLACPFQHLHQWQNLHGDNDDNDGDDGRLSSAESISPFKQGQLKVLMMEGVVYRFVDVANMKLVEIYPGDGSVLISQGATARFFSHLMWKGGKLEEKAYSVKMLPPKPPSAPYSVQHLIKRAHRLLTGCIHNSPLSQREALPCWKQAVTQVVEPLSSSLLEECTVAAYGRFQAYSNGRVRVVFEDRTSLDMGADFSRRLHDCGKHSSVSEMSMLESLAAVKLTSSGAQLQSSQCRLLLPSGKYVMVELLKPGPYRRYVDAAKEWVQWVQSSPKERRQFYQEKATPHTARLSAEAELKKIECFNYIVDHSAIPNSSQHSTSPPPTSALSSHSTMYHSSGRPLSHVAPLAAPQYSTHSQSVPHLAQSLGCGRVEGTSDLNSSSRVFASDPKDLAMLQGFQSVKEALLRTSQMIREIDDIVQDRKESGSDHSH
ncbi:hypothetical protein ACOMHN_049748 [Nucella lapillus]